MDRDTPRSRNGITLIEVLVAVGLTGVAILCASGVLRQVEAVSRQVIDQASAVRIREARAEFVRSLVAQVVSPRDTTELFEGSKSLARFQTLCRKSRGWLEPCQATFRVVRAGDSVSLVVEATESPAITAVTKATAISLLYLADARDGGHWVESWGSSIGVPFGIGVVRQFGEVTDTVFLRIGTRG